MNYLPLGSFDTARSQDEIILVLLKVIERQDKSVFEQIHQRVCKTRSEKERFIRSLVKKLNVYAPPFTYVGHAPHDESDWGVWIDLPKLNEAERKKILGPIKGRSRYVLVHDSTGLKLLQRKGWVEVWRL